MLFRSNDTATTEIYTVEHTLSLHDALPIIVAAGGATMGSMNAGWFGLGRDANALFPLLGVGAGLVVVGFARSSLTRRLHEAGWLGRAARYLLVVAPVLLILNASSIAVLWFGAHRVDSGEMQIGALKIGRAHV